MTTYIKQNVAYPLIVAVIDNNGDFVTGLTITYEVRKSSDNSLITSGTLTNTGNIYTDSVTISTTGDYYVLYFSPTDYENGKEILIVNINNIDDIATDLEDIAEKLCKVLGLVQSNYRLTNQIYNSDGCLTSATISIYNSANDTDSQTNPIATYTITATYNSTGELIDYKVTED